MNVFSALLMAGALIFPVAITAQDPIKVPKVRQADLSAKPKTSTPRPRPKPTEMKGCYTQRVPMARDLYYNDTPYEFNWPRKESAETVRLLGDDELNDEQLFARGYNYEKGSSGMPQDYVRALALYRTAADHGHIGAQNYVGYMLKNGRGTEQNFQEAMYWFRLAADQGDAIAQCNVGVLYENGQGVERDYAAAFYWYELSAFGGYAIAQRNLGVLYETGLGVEKNLDEAAEWYRAAYHNPQSFAQLQQIVTDDLARLGSHP